MICPNCKREAGEGYRFCQYCGRAINNNQEHSDNYPRNINQAPKNQGSGKKPNSVLIALLILAAGVLFSAAIIFIGYNVIKGRSLQERAEGKIISTEEEEETLKKKKKKDKKETTEEEASVQESSEETEAESTLESPAYEETTMAATPVYITLYVVNCKQSISLRSAPSTQATAIRQIPLGSAVSFIQNSTDGFYQVSYMGDTGYALASFLSENPSNSYRPPQTYSYNNYNYDYDDGGWYGYVVECKESITLRESPSTSAREIMQIPLHSVIWVNNYVGSDFLYVSYDGYRGYVLARYVEEY